MRYGHRLLNAAVWAGLVVSVFAVSESADAEPMVRVTLLDGAVKAGRFDGVSRQSVRIQIDGKTESLAVDDISRIEFAGGKRSAITPGDCELLMPLGGRLIGSLGVGEQGNLLLRTSKLGTLTVPVDRVAAIRLISSDSALAADKIFMERLADPLPARDVLITRGNEPKALRGSLVEIGPGASRFMYNDRERSLQTEKIQGIVLAHSVRNNASDQNATVVLGGNQRLRCRLVESYAEGLVVDAGFAHLVAVPIQHVVRVDIDSSRVTYLSDHSITTRRHEGIVHRSRRVRLDRNVANQPIRLGGRVFNKGLGMQSDSEVVFDLDGSYETLAATVGIDDAVSHRGRARFIVTVDGEVAYSETISGKDDPFKLVVPVNGARRLSLRVDHADDSDVADWANWGSARLIRVKSSS